MSVCKQVNKYTYLKLQNLFYFLLLLEVNLTNLTVEGSHLTPSSQQV